MATRWMLASRAWAGPIRSGSFFVFRPLQPPRATCRLGNFLKPVWGRCMTPISPVYNIFSHVKWGSTTSTPSTKPTAQAKRCVLCNLDFPTTKELREHVKTSSQHTHCCMRCKLSFESDEALQQHLRESTKHNICTECDHKLDFSSSKRLELHKKKVHGAKRTPLDQFFFRFPSFKYDPALPPATSYAELRKHMKWKKDTKESNDGWLQYQQALLDEVRLFFGNEDDLVAWHTLCKALGISPPPESIKKCKRRVRDIHVNIVDLIEWAKSGEHEKRVEVFKTVRDLSQYSRDNKKIFLREGVENDDGERNIVLRHLLRHLFTYPGMVINTTQKS